MIERHLAGTTVELTFDAGEQAPVSAVFSLIDDTGAFLEIDTPASISGNSVTVTIPSESNLVEASATSARTVILKLSYADGSTEKQRRSYVLTGDVTLEPGPHSALTYTKFLAMYEVMPQGPLAEAEELDQIRALLAAHRNIAKLPLTFPEEFVGVNRVSDLTKDQALYLQTNHRSMYEQLCQAQIVEADGILGAYPVEDRRRADMISESAGESARFFRTSRPVRLPVYRATADALTGLIDWTGAPRKATSI